MTLVNLCEPRSANFEWENGQSFSQNIDGDDFPTGDFSLSGSLTKYIEKIEIPEDDKKWICDYLLTKMDIVMNK